MTFREQVHDKPPILLDGGLGSSLLARGLERGTPPEIWNLERGDEVTHVHRSFVEAGSHAIHTNTFGASPIRLAVFGLEERCEEINRVAVGLARAAQPSYVIGDIGPTGEYLPPVGSGDATRWRAAFERQANALLAAGVDAIHIETMSDLREARVALESSLTAAVDIPVMVSLTFDQKKRGFFTVMGNALVPSLSSLSKDGAFAVGANCSITSGAMWELMREARGGIDAFLVAQPNAGNPEIAVDGRAVYAQAPEAFADDMASVAAHGVALVGGCCGTDDRFIAALAARLSHERETAT